MSDTETVDLETAGLLDADTIPNANQSLTCFSCGEDMSGVYCYACGNKNDNFRRSIWSLGAELFASLTALEGRIWRSLRSLLFKPGRMAREFSDGARQKWTSPIRMYLATSLLLFGYVALSQTQLIAFGTTFKENSAVQMEFGGKNLVPQIFFLERKSTINKLVSSEAIKIFEQDMLNMINDDDSKTKEQLEADLTRTRDNLAKLDTQIETANNKYAKLGLSQGRKSLMERIKSLEESIENFDLKSDEDTEAGNTSEDGNSDDEAQNSEDGNLHIVDATGNAMTLDAAGIRRAISIGLRQPEKINAPIGKYLPRIMFIMMPFSMLMGAIFIRGRKKAMLFDHLVHAAYIHAFSFLLLFVFMLLVQFTPIKGLLWIYMGIILIYLPLSAKHMFGRGWFKTFLASYGVGFIYTTIMAVILTFLVGMGVSDIAAEVSLKAPV